jgi:hypothetical protein
MYWYRLVQLTQDERSRPASARLWLTAAGGRSPTASLSRQQRWKLFWLGLAEAAPIIAGAVFSIYTDSKVHAVIAALLALVLTGFISWLLRHQVPLTRIELSTARPNQAIQPTAGPCTASVSND